MWLFFSFVSATIVGFRDFFKKIALRGNDILWVLCLVTVLSALMFMPFILASRCTDWLDTSFFYVPQSTLQLHLCSLVKCLLLICCWFCSFYGIKHLPLTVSGIIAAFGPVETVVAATLIFGETLNPMQWAGVLVSTFSLVLVGLGTKDKSTDFVCGRHFWIMILSTVFSAAAALWDKFAMGRVEDGGMGMSVMFIQSWYNIYQAAILSTILLFTVKRSKGGNIARSQLSKLVALVFMVSLCEVVADLLYDAALQIPGCLVSIMAIVRRGSVMVSFILGIAILKERNIGKRLLDLILVLSGMLLIYFGSR